MFCEMRALNEFILEQISSPGTARWHWPSYYLLYVDLDRMARLVRRAGELFVPERTGRPFVPQGECDLRPDEFAARVNETFADMQKIQLSIVGWLWEISRNTMTVVEDKMLWQRMRARFHPKSE